MLSGVIAIVIGSVLGGCARYFVSGAIARRLGETFPWGTMTINITGAFLIGIFGALATHPGSIFAAPNPVAVRGDRVPRLLHHGVLVQPANADPRAQRRAAACARQCRALGRAVPCRRQLRLFPR